MQPSALKESAVARVQAGEFPVQVAASLGVTSWLVRDWCRKAGVTLSKAAGLRAAYAWGGRKPNGPLKYTVDAAVFERDLTPTSAWLLGVIAGDGCVVRSYGQITALEVCGDEDVCRKAAAALGSNAPLRHLTASCFDLKVSSRPLARSLARYGFGPAKTYDLKFPELPEAMLPHFVRGYWDADGCVTHATVRDTKHLVLAAVTVSESFADTLAELVCRVTGASIVPHRQVVGDPPATRKIVGRVDSFRVGLTRGSALKFGEWLWQDSKPHNRSDRKYARYQELIHGAA